MLRKGDSPKRNTSGAQKSLITRRAASAAVSVSASGWTSATWLPRPAGSRRESTLTPSRATAVSANSIAYPVSPTNFARIASIPASIESPIRGHTDPTSVCVYKLCAAELDARPGRARLPLLADAFHSGASSPTGHPATGCCSRGLEIQSSSPESPESV